MDMVSAYRSTIDELSYIDTQKKLLTCSIKIAFFHFAQHFAMRACIEQTLLLWSILSVVVSQKVFFLFAATADGHFSYVRFLLLSPYADVFIFAESVLFLLRSFSFHQDYRYAFDAKFQKKSRTIGKSKTRHK